ncbi:MAG: hypothetical protein JXP73_01195 [Deltaproteobacteria bacterium]|nr:hypothetical protein [Deltaproteobacteria bacterium]
MKRPWFARSWVWPVFALATALRLLLAAVNRWANDPHMEVVHRILDTGVLPKARECWECHHPKLFYLAVAGVAKALSLRSETSLVLAAQFLNVAFAIGALFLLARFLNRLATSDALRSLVFAVVALNPSWLGISAQATNDSMVIAFGVAAFVASHGFFANPSGGRLLACVLACALAAATKASGVLVTLLCLFNIGLGLLSQRWREARSALLGRWGVIALLLLVPLPLLGGYLSSHRITGDPFTLVIARRPPPSFLQETQDPKPGIVSIVSGYFTFRLADMLAHPYTENEPAPLPRHRTSFWSQLYGRAFFARFESWPPQWQSRRPQVLLLGRIALLTGLPVLAVFWLGVAGSLRAIWRRRAAMGARTLDREGFLRLAALAGTGVFVLALLRVTYVYRSYITFKFIYVLPALCGFALLCLEGWRILEKRRPRLFRLVAAAALLLVLVHAVDVGWLVYDLAKQG